MSSKKQQKAMTTTQTQSAPAPPVSAPQPPPVPPTSSMRASSHVQPVQPVAVPAKQKPTLIAKKDEKPHVRVPPVRDEEMDDEELAEELDEDDMEDDMDDGEMDMGNPAVVVQMMNSVLSNFFEHVDEQGNQVNVVDALLLVRNSIDKQSKCILKLSQELETLNKKSSK